jgi:hypothetical protein
MGHSAERRTERACDVRTRELAAGPAERQRQAGGPHAVRLQGAAALVSVTVPQADSRRVPGQPGDDMPDQAVTAPLGHFRACVSISPHTPHEHPDDRNVIPVKSRSFSVVHRSSS